MLAILTVIILFILGPIVLMGFVVTLVLPIVYLALRSKIKDPAATSTTNDTQPQGTGG